MRQHVDPMLPPSGGAVCLLLAGFLAGCSEQGTSPKSAAPVSAKSPAPSAAAATAVNRGSGQKPHAPAKTACKR